MPSISRGARGAVAGAAVLAGVSVSMAQAELDRRGATGSPGAVFEQPLELKQPPRDRFGNPALSSSMVWRPICGSRPGAMTPGDLAAIAAGHAALFSRDESRQTVGTALSIDFQFSASVPADVRAAMIDAASVIELYFGDFVTIEIEVDWADLGEGTLGSTGVLHSIMTYESVRDALVADMDSDDVIQAWLPGGPGIPVRYDEASSTVTEESEISVAWANLKALGGTAGDHVASMTLNSTKPWDLDPSDGIADGTWDLESVVTHEIGHALGFFSWVDLPGDGMSVLDMFRFRHTDGCCDYDPDTLAEFTATPRLADFNDPNDSHTFDIIEAEHRLSDGAPWQASHFRQQPSAIGNMDPTQGEAESFWPAYYQTSDVRVFDAIGWDHPPILVAQALPFADDFPSNVIDNTKWLGVDGAEANARGANEPSPSWSLNLDATFPGGDQARSTLLDTTSAPAPVLRYWYQRGGTDDPPEPGDDLVVEYLDGQGQWIELNRHLGDGPVMTVYEFVSIALPPDAAHTGFRLRVRATTDDDANDDDWFIDDLCIGADADCPAPTSCLDLDDDDAVGTSDLLALLAQWGTDPGGPPDYDGSGNVGTEDLLALLAAWGACP